MNSSLFVVTVCWYRTMSSTQDGCSARESEERCKVSECIIKAIWYTAR